MWFKICLVIGLCFLIVLDVNASSNSAVALPFEVEQTLLQRLNKTELDTLDISDRSVVPIYRKDLRPDYIAYYQIDLQGKDFFLISAGEKTGDYKESQSGPAPLPTKVLQYQANKAGQECKKFFILCSVGVYMCENAKGRAVAATYDWIADRPIQDWKAIQNMVKNSSSTFKKDWKKVAEASKLEWETSQRKQVNKKPSLSEYNAEVVLPGSTNELALGANYTKITVHAIPLSRQKQLCDILNDVCKDQSNTVNKDLIQKSKCGIEYLPFKIKTGIKKILKNKEISFYFKIKTKDDQQVLQYFSVDLSKQNKSQEAENDYTFVSDQIWKVPNWELLPDYDQHPCCGCVSGCGAVAWGMILAYYDNLAHTNPQSGYSQDLWSNTDGNNGRAPNTMTKDARRYMAKINEKIKTVCHNNGGGTYWRDMKRIRDFCTDRGVRMVIDEGYDPPSNRDDTIFTSETISLVREGYPVVVDINVETGKHYAVVLQHRLTRFLYRECQGTVCKRARIHDDNQFYMNMGWGNYSNGWKRNTIFSYFALKRGD